MNDTLHLKIWVGLVDAILGTLNLFLTKKNVNLQTLVLTVKKSFLVIAKAEKGQSLSSKIFPKIGFKATIVF